MKDEGGPGPAQGSASLPTLHPLSPAPTHAIQPWQNRPKVTSTLRPPTDSLPTGKAPRVRTADKRHSFEISIQKEVRRNEVYPQQPHLQIDLPSNSN